MIFKTLKIQKIIKMYEIYYYYLYLFINFKISYTYFYMSNFKYFIKNLFNNTNANDFLKNNQFVKYSNLNINYKINVTNNKYNHDRFSKHNSNIIFCEKYIKSYDKLFSLFFLLNYSLFNSNFKYHHNFKFFYVYNYSNQLIIINYKKFISR